MSRKPFLLYSWASIRCIRSPGTKTHTETVSLTHSLTHSLRLEYTTHCLPFQMRWHGKSTHNDIVYFNLGAGLVSLSIFHLSLVLHWAQTHFCEGYWWNPRTAIVLDDGYWVGSVVFNKPWALCVQWLSLWCLWFRFRSWALRGTPIPTCNARFRMN